MNRTEAIELAQKKANAEHEPRAVASRAPCSCSACGSLREAVLRLRTEVNCRIEHGAESSGHLDYVQAKLDAILKPNKELSDDSVE